MNSATEAILTWSIRDQVLFYLYFTLAKAKPRPVIQGAVAHCNYFTNESNVDVADHKSHYLFHFDIDIQRFDLEYFFMFRQADLIWRQR